MKRCMCEGVSGGTFFFLSTVSTVWDAYSRGFVLQVLMAEAGPVMKDIVKQQAAQVEVASKGKSSGKGKGGKEKEVSGSAVFDH